MVDPFALRLDVSLALPVALRISFSLRLAVIRACILSPFLSLSLFCSLRLRQSTFVFSRHYSTDRLNILTTRERRTHMSSASSLVFARRHRQRVEAGARVYAHPARRVKNAGDAAVETTMSSATTLPPLSRTVKTALVGPAGCIAPFHTLFSRIVMLSVVSIDG